MFTRIAPLRVLAAAAALGLAATALPAQSFTRIQNRFRPTTFLHTETGSVECGNVQPGWWSADWVLEPVAENIQFFRIRNRFRGTYIHIEHGAVASSPLGDPGWHSAQWTRESVPGTNFVRLRNRWRPNIYLHTEQGRLAASPIDPGWWSAQWALVSSPNSANAGAGGGDLQSLLQAVVSRHFHTASALRITAPGTPNYATIDARRQVLQDSIALLQRLLAIQTTPRVSEQDIQLRIRELTQMRARLYEQLYALPSTSPDAIRIGRETGLMTREINLLSQPR